MRLPLPPFEPDKSIFDPSVSSSVINALPAAKGWKPMPSFAEVSQDLGSTCLGGISVRKADGTDVILAATLTTIYRLDTSDNSWDSINGASGPYTGPPSGEAWEFTQFGAFVVVHNYNDPIQVYDIEAGGVLADLGGTPPQARYSWAAGDFLVLGNLNESNGQGKVYWSELNNIAGWTIGENGCDFQELPEGNEVVAGFAAPGGFIVMQRSAMQLFSFAPSSGFTFTRTVINPSYGAIAPRSVVNVGPNQFYYLSEDGFFAGADRRPIGAERVDEYLTQQIDRTYLPEVQGAADPFEKIVWWRYRTTNGDFRLLGYDYQLDRWCTSDADVGEMIAISTPSVSIDSLDAIYGNLDAVPVSLDSRIFAGGLPTFATFTPDNKLAYFNGANLEAVFETAQVQTDPNARAFCIGSRLITDATTFQIEHGTTPYHGQPVTYAAAVTQNRAGYCPHRGDGRLHQFRATIPAGTVWSEASAIDADFKLTGLQ